jgi:hypothetical protein
MKSEKTRIKIMMSMADPVLTDILHRRVKLLEDKPSVARKRAEEALNEEMVKRQEELK